MYHEIMKLGIILMMSSIYIGAAGIVITHWINRRIKNHDEWEE